MSIHFLRSNVFYIIKIKDNPKTSPILKTYINDILQSKYSVKIFATEYIKYMFDNKIYFYSKDLLNLFIIHKHFFDDIFISEEIGFSKPEPEIFEYSVKKLGDFEKNEILMIGDNLVADIMGGINFGVDTCWVNLKNKENNKEIVPKYEINNLLELLEVLN